MKILIFEYITGGGLSRQSLPASLLAEGEMMVSALVEDLLAVDGVELMLTRDCRLSIEKSLTADQITVINISPEQGIDSLLVDLVDQCDAVWPIAPETDSVLYQLCRLIESRNTTLLCSSSQGVKIASDKMATYQHLKPYDIPLVETYRHNDYDDIDKHNQSWVIKPSDGVGCEGIRKLNWQQLKSTPVSEELLVQPFIQGRSLSLSCLFHHGQGRLICINEQLIEQKNDQFLLQGLLVNIAGDKQIYSKLVRQIAEAMPLLWGYIGIDLIEAEQGPLLLEINPRLTTSYTGIKKALGINIGASVLELLSKTPELKSSRNQQISINIADVRH